MEKKDVKREEWETTASRKSEKRRLIILYNKERFEGGIVKKKETPFTR